MAPWMLYYLTVRVITETAAVITLLGFLCILSVIIWYQLERKPHDGQGPHQAP